jgi:hypothetical protein
MNGDQAKAQDDIGAEVAAFLADAPLSRSLGLEVLETQSNASGARAAIVSQFKPQYVDLLSELHGWFADKSNIELADPMAVRVSISLLQRCRQSLLESRCSMSNLATMLYEAEKSLVHFTPMHELAIRARRILSELDGLHTPEREELKVLLEPLISQTSLTSLSNSDTSLAFRSLIQTGLAAAHRHELARIIAGDLKVQWLKALLRWSFVVLGVLVLTSPLTIAQTATASWSTESWIHSLISTRDDQSHALVTTIGTWLNSISMSGLGATGGLLSGILQIRKVRVVPFRYEQDRCLSQLRPAIGAVISMVLVIMLSWKVVPIVENGNEGACLLMAFLSGFSERYFLSLFKMGNEPEMRQVS